MVKGGDGKSWKTLSPSFSHFKATLAKARKIQIVMNCEREKTSPDGLEIRGAAAYLATIDLGK